MHNNIHDGANQMSLCMFLPIHLVGLLVVNRRGWFFNSASDYMQGGPTQNFYKDLFYISYYGFTLTREKQRLSRAHISERQTPGLTRGSPPHVLYKGGEPQVKPGVWRPEMWAQVKHCIKGTVSRDFRPSVFSLNSEFEFICKTVLVHESEDPGVQFDEKTRGRKSRETITFYGNSL
jgi:hypothetical protein